MDINLRIPHLREFVSPWRELLGVNLREDMGYSIT
jgi:hypothetical protein